MLYKYNNSIKENGVNSSKVLEGENIIYKDRKRL